MKSPGAGKDEIVWLLIELTTISISKNTSEKKIHKNLKNSQPCRRKRLRIYEKKLVLVSHGTPIVVTMINSTKHIYEITLNILHRQHEEIIRNIKHMNSH